MIEVNPLYAFKLNRVMIAGAVSSDFVMQSEVTVVEVGSWTRAFISPVFTCEI